MNWRNTAQRYGFLAQIFHWLVVILLVAQFSLIWYADDMPRGAEKAAVIGTHKALGITILAIIVLRVLWRFINPTPALPKDLDRRLGWVAHGTHWLLYALVLALPIVGWSMSSAGGHPVDYFGLFKLPLILGQSKATAHALGEVHETLATILLIVAGIHVAAALWHHFIRKDNTLRKMLPGAD